MFTRTDTKAVKGAAILLMLLHHLAGFSSRWPVGFTGFFSLIPGFVEDGWLADLARNALVCVPLFFFLGGYGLYKRRQAGSFRLLDAVFSLYKQYWRVFVIFVPLAFLFFARPANTMPAFSVRYVIDSPRQFFIDLLGNLFGYKATFNSEWWFFGAYLCTLPLGCLFCRAIRRHESFLGDIFLVFVIDILTQNIFPALAGTTVFSGLNSNLYFYRFFELNKHAAPFFAGIVFAKYDGLAAIKRRLEAVPCRGLAALAGTAAVLLCRAYVTTDRASADVVLVPLLTAFLSALFDSLAAVKDAFVFLGRHSTNMWLIHTFYCYYFLEFTRLVYCTHIVWVDLAVLLALSLWTSVLLELLYRYAGMLWQRIRGADVPAAQ